MSAAVARSRHHNNRTILMKPEQLHPRHHLLVEYMLHGITHASLCHRTKVIDHYDRDTGEPILRHPRVGEPLDLIAAAEVLRIKRRHARSLSAQPVFQRLLASETQAFRDGARARATRRMAALIDDPGQGKAADRKVQLSASQAVLGEGDGNRAGPTVNVFNGTTQIAGLVIVDPRNRSRDDAPTRSIEHESGPT